MSNKNKLYNSGNTPRVIFYSQSSKGHEYNYGSPLVTITGKNSRHIPQSTSKERKLLDYIKHHPQPNSKRTIIPNYGNPDNLKFNKNNSKINYSTMDNTFCEKIVKKEKPSIKTSRNKNKTSNDLLNNFKDEKKILNYNPNKKNQISFNIKNKYDYCSEIINLPGGHKRKINDIKDDYAYITKKTNMNSTADCFRERNINPTKIDCLCPNSKNKINRPYSLNKTTKTNYKQSLHNNILNNCSDLIYSSNNIFYKNNYYNNHNNDNNKKNYENNYNKYLNRINKDINNKENKENYFNNYNTNTYNYFKSNNTKVNKINKNDYSTDYPLKTEINKTFDNNQNINNNKIIPKYFNNIYKEKRNSLVTHYTKRRNMNSFNKLFNEVHQESNNYSLMNQYGKNYSKKNYSQIELH